MKIIITYTLAAASLGILLALVPLLASVEINPTNTHPVSLSLLEKMREVEGYSSLKSQENVSDEVTVLAISFVIACIGYMALKRKMPHSKHQWGGFTSKY